MRKKGSQFKDAYISKVTKNFKLKRLKEKESVFAPFPNLLLGLNKLSGIQKSLFIKRICA